jgi:hypothetical protein
MKECASERYFEHFGEALLAARSDRECEAVAHPLDPAKLECAFSDGDAERAGNVGPALRPIPVTQNASLVCSAVDLNAEIA